MSANVGPELPKCSTCGKTGDAVGDQELGRFYCAGGTCWSNRKVDDLHDRLLAALGWRKGEVEQALVEVRRLREFPPALAFDHETEVRTVLNAHRSESTVDAAKDMAERNAELRKALAIRLVLLDRELTNVKVRTKDGRDGQIKGVTILYALEVEDPVGTDRYGDTYGFVDESMTADLFHVVDAKSVDEDLFDQPVATRTEGLR